MQRTDREIRAQTQNSSATATRGGSKGDLLQLRLILNGETASKGFLPDEFARLAKGGPPVCCSVTINHTHRKSNRYSLNYL